MQPRHLPTPDQTRAALEQLAAMKTGGAGELNAMAAGMSAAEARGGHKPEIATLLNATQSATPGITIHGFTFQQPSFGALQVLDEIGSPLLVGGAVKLGEIAAAMCVLENPDLCWGLLNADQGGNLFNDRVWNRTKDLSPKHATAIAEVMIREIRLACGIVAEEGEEGTAGNGAVPAAPAPAPTPAGLPPLSTGSVPTTDSPSATPSGSFLLPPLVSSSMPGPSGPEASPPAPVLPTAPASPPSVNGSAASAGQVYECDGHTFPDRESYLIYLNNKAQIVMQAKSI